MSKRFGRNRLLPFLLLGLLAPLRPAAAQVGHPEIISQPLAHRHGLTRTWISRVQLDPGRGRVKEITLHGDTLIAITDQAAVHAFDAETGRTRWIATVGKRNHPSTPVGASESYVALCNGTTLYVLNRHDGKLLFTRKVEGSPSAAPAVSETRVYIPTLAGAVETYSINLKEPKVTPSTYRSNGTIEEPPVLAGDNVIWATHAGAVYSANRDDLTAIYRFKTRGEITAGLGYWPPLVYAASADGYIYAIDEKTGAKRWQFATAFPSRETPVPLDGNLYAISELSGMFCLSADRGVQRWYTQGVSKFISASATRLYTADETGRMVVLDRLSGAHLDTLPTELLPIKVNNIQNDRLYLATTTGIVQCLREIDQVQPLVHVLPTPAPVPRGPAPPPTEGGDAAADAPAAPAEDDPFGADPAN